MWKIDELCKKFPKICNCPYKDDIDKDLQKGKTPYYVSNWLKDTECKISYSTISRYRKYLLDNKLLQQKSASPSDNEDELLSLLEKKTTKALKNLELESANPNVQVQFILGALKLIVGTKQQVDINADINSEITTNLLDKIKVKRGELDCVGSN